jgi:hypothetical protein
MMDLHLFLGRPVSCTYSGPASANSSSSSDSSTAATAAAAAGYDLSEMTPELVHYGGFPQQVSALQQYLYRVCYAVLFVDAIKNKLSARKVALCIGVHNPQRSAAAE